MFKVVFLMEDKGSSGDLRSAWLVIKYLTEQAIKKGEINWQMLDSIWVEEQSMPKKIHTFYQMRDLFAT